MLARYGGDEFVLVCENVTETDVYRIVERISAAVRSVSAADPRFRRLGASVGMAWRDAEHRSPDELLSAADASMYRVKRADRA
jgi:diguanylate cyclase (GGDEF)-like protein